MTKPKWVLAVIRSVPKEERIIHVGKAIWVENTPPHAAPEELAFDAMDDEWMVASEDAVYFTYIAATPGTKYKQVQIPSNTIELLPVYRYEMDLISLEEWLDDKTDPMQLMQEGCDVDTVDEKRTLH